ncbi:hypothetical protein TNCV_2712421 [Trichonephila clavipes]|nr:hypothetical protein TNCV_2712421 [Trichonephila clavipes]
MDLIYASSEKSPKCILAFTGPPRWRSASIVHAFRDMSSHPRSAAVGVRHHFFTFSPMLSGKSAFRTRNDDNDILPRPRGARTSLFSVEGTEKSLLHSRARLFGARGTMKRHTTAAARRWVFVTLFPSRHYSAVWSRLGARGTMTTTSYRSRSAVSVRHFFPSRHYSPVRSRLGATWNDDNDTSKVLSLK